MFSIVHKHIVEKIENVVIEKDPYPHFVITDFFPQFFYEELLKNDISVDQMINLKESKRVGSGYSDSRYVLKLEKELNSLKTNKTFYENLAKYIEYFLSNLLLQKFNQPTQNVITDILYTKDYKSYSLGPHTDKRTKVLTSLIYLPKDNNSKNIGTSIYVPKDRTFRCPGGPHHKLENFELVKTIPYLPNTMFCFLKTDNSFHGVEKINEDIERTLLIIDLQKK